MSQSTVGKNILFWAEHDRIPGYWRADFYDDGTCIFVGPEKTRRFTWEYADGELNITIYDFTDVSTDVERKSQLAYEAYLARLIVGPQ